MVCKDSLGSFSWGFMDNLKSISTFMTKALALKRALMLAVDLGHDKDCLFLKSCVDARVPDLYDWKCRSIIYDIICLLSTKVGFSVSFAPRRGNRVADCLAAEAYKEMYPLRWVNQLSPALLSFLTLDLPEMECIRNDVAASGPILSGV